MIQLLPSTTLNFNTVAPIDATTWRPYNWPMPGLRTKINRGLHLSRHLTNNGQDMTNADAFVNGNIAQGLEPLALLTGDPGVPYDPVAEGNHYKMLALRYGNKVKYEMCNEVDTDGSWCYDGNDGGTLAGLAWRTAVDAFSLDPSIIVICGSIQSIWPTGHGLQVLEKALKAFGPNLPTDISFHCYPTLDQVSTVPAMIERVRGACLAHAKGDPRLWITEWAPWPAIFSTMTASNQGTFLRTMFRYFRDSNVYASLHYLFDDPNGFGFTDRNKGKTVWNSAMSTVFGAVL